MADAAALEERRKRSNAYSKQMSEMLLKGWKMLDEYCPVTGDVPLMQNKEGRKFSVSVGKFVDEIDQNTSSPAPAPTPISSPAKLSNQADAAITRAYGGAPPIIEDDFEDDGWTPPTAEEMKVIEEKQKRSDGFSKKMSGMLLQGWKMLNEYCPVTGEVPLMQNRQGRKYSVAIEKFMDEMDTSPAAPAPPPAPAPVPAPAPMPAPAPAPTPVRASPVRQSPASQYNESLQYYSTRSTEQSYSIPRPVEVESSGAEAGVLLKAEQAICRKLERATLQLESTEDPHQAVVILQLIEGCSKALHAVRASRR
jgi:uncharacterized Zn finger protein (UPF0148 family)